MWLVETYLLIAYVANSIEMEHFSIKIDKDLFAAYETFLVIFPSVLLIYAVTYLTMWNPQRKLRTFFLEYSLIALPMLLNVTLFVRSIYQVLAVLLIASLYITTRTNQILSAPKPKDEAKHFTFITNARSTISLLTAIAILAVDFKIFPKRFAKTRKYGFSLMDVGVGLFIYANGIVAPKRNEPVTKLIRDSLPLFILGIGRYLVTREINYHVAVWEYGVHWNFFITLGITKVFSSLLIKAIGTRNLFLSAPFLLALHEALLQSGLAHYVFGPADRKESFIAANREGIVSSLGYIGLYLLSVPIGDVLKTRVGNERGMFAKLTGLCAGLLLATAVLHYFFGTSRRLANSSYCCWTLFIGVFMTEMYYLCELMHRRVTRSKVVPSPFIFEAINYNGLAFFLVCNVLTGFVNIIFNTRKIKTLESVVILSVYLLVTCAVVAALYVRKIRLKL